MRGRNYTRIFSIAGLVLGEIYMFYVVLAPKHRGAPIPINIPVPLATLPAGTATPAGAHIMELVLLSPFFGIFGALVGLGIGLLVTGLLQKRQPPAQ